MPVLMLNESEVQQLLTMDMALDGVEAGLRKIALDEGENITRNRARTDHAMLHILAASAKTLGYLGYKSYVTTKDGAHFHVGLYDGKSGDLLALMQADYLGQVRTGAASGIATKFLARDDATTLGILGSGKQARTQVEAICKVRSINRVHVYSPNVENRSKFAQEMSDRCQTEVIAVNDPESAVRNLDILVTATTSREPVLHGSWVAEGSHINAIGSNFRGKVEVDVPTIQACSHIFVDSKAQARIEAGDFFPAIDENILEWSDVRELGKVLIGRYNGREHPHEITLFKSLGIAIEDVAVAGAVYQKAIEQNVGRQWEW